MPTWQDYGFSTFYSFLQRLAMLEHRMCLWRSPVIQIICKYEDKEIQIRQTFGEMVTPLQYSHQTQRNAAHGVEGWVPVQGKFSCYNINK